MTDRPTIAHVLHQLQVAGAEVLAADLSRQLAPRFRFVFFCLDAIGPLGEALRGEGFEVIALGRRPGLDRAVARRMRGHIQRLGVSLLHAHQYTPFFYASLARRPFPWPARPPLLFTEHGRHYPDRRKAKRVLANRFLLRRSDRATAVGGFVKSALVENEGIPAERIEVVRNGIDPASFGPPDAAARRAARAELAIGDEQPVLLQVARFHPVKDHATALRAMAGVVASAPNAVLLLAGDGELRAALEAQAAALGLAGRVRFLGVRRDVPRLMAAADVFLLSSLSEGISVTLLEAMGCGLPIAATDVGGNGEVVEPGITGLLSPRGDAAGLAHNLAALLRDPALRRRLGDAGRARLLERFTRQQMHRRYAEIYGEMLGLVA
jgi:glycosyltransferase involved in cell wall biosynthesis